MHGVIFTFSSLMNSSKHITQEEGSSRVNVVVSIFILVSGACASHGSLSERLSPGRGDILLMCSASCVDPSPIVDLSNRRAIAIEITVYKKEKIGKI